MEARKSVPQTLAEAFANQYEAIYHTRYKMWLIRDKYSDDGTQWLLYLQEEIGTKIGEKQLQYKTRDRNDARARLESTLSFDLGMATETHITPFDMPWDHINNKPVHDVFPGKTGLWYLDQNSKLKCLKYSNRYSSPYCSAYDPDDKMETPLYNDVLLYAFNGDPQNYIPAIHTHYGFALLGNNGDDTIVFYTGVGGAGKTLLAGLLQEALGQLSTSVGFEALAGRFGTAGLVGKRLCVVDEPDPSKARRALQVMNSASSGRGMVAVEFKHGANTQAKLSVRFLLTANELLTSTSAEEGMQRRRVVIDFKNKVPEDKVDRNLNEKLDRELPGIIYTWLIDSSKHYTTPRPLDQDYFNEKIKSIAQPIQYWFDTHCEIIEGADTPVTKLWASYCDYIGQDYSYMDLPDRTWSNVIQKMPGVERSKLKRLEKGKDPVRVRPNLALKKGES